jgi:hypothetical protein
LRDQSAYKSITDTSKAQHIHTLVESGECINIPVCAKLADSEKSSINLTCFMGSMLLISEWSFAMLAFMWN